MARGEGRVVSARRQPVGVCGKSWNDIYHNLFCVVYSSHSLSLSLSLSDPTFVVSSQRDHAKESFKAHTSVDRIVRNSNLYIKPNYKPRLSTQATPLHWEGAWLVCMMYMY